MKRFSMLIVLALAAALAMSSVASAAANRLTLTFGDVYPEGHYYTEADRLFAQLVEEYTAGAVTIDYYPAEQLGSEREQLEATRAGAQHLTETTPGMLATVYPRVGVLELPYLFNGPEHMHQAMDVVLGLMGEEMAQQTGVRVLFWRERAPRLLTSRIPVFSVSDIKNLRIRVSEVPVRVAFWKALGTIPTPLPMGEVYTSLATGVVDAQENPADTISAWKLQEQQPYLALTEHMREIIVIVINEQLWQSLSPDIQDALRRAGEESAAWSNQMTHILQDQELQKLMDAGVKVTYPNRTEFIERARSIYAQFGDPTIYEQIIKLGSDS